ncbi:MAG: hybrid sensor histidine kinase/response regulator [Ignavibacteria bacterium]|jgi:CheY-like chemotaxis protein|nr:hybrid sensor histidine kinase/response regulator [Ignavibacteria bacterium]MCU7504626.1 hybrid sensor histidine kinase/response regulator [Ignavibacteria bacterium]MCU7517958.1 hybrid sensor histidine kinase/response regulator [Ignavibacteria bacterium]
MEKILVIEDEDNVRSSIRDLLQGVGYDVLEAENGRKGLELIRSSNPDLIISDIMMPEMDGHALLEETQKDPLTAAIPFIFLTAKVTLSDMRLAMNMGADDYLTKPFRLGDLLKAINTRLEKKKKLDEKIKNITDNITKYIPHELRTPLVSIAGFSDILLNDLDSLQPDEVLTIVSRIKKGSLRLHATIEKFLVYLETELIAENPHYRLECYNAVLKSPDEVIKSAVLSTASKAERQDDVKILQSCSSPVYMTAQFLETTIGALVENALKFSEAGSTVKIRSFSDGGFYRLEVEDYGAGMTKEQIAMVAPFTQFNRDYVQQSGIGLGLASIKNIADICGGSLNIESRPGEYTKVSVAFRAAENF